MSKMRDSPPGKEFVFKLPNGAVVGRAKNVMEFVNMIKNAPLDCILFHAKGGHFSPWLEMMGESEISSRLKKMPVNDKTIRISLLKAIGR